MHKEKKEVLDDSPRIVDWCYIGEVKVYENKSRSNGYFYANVPFMHERHTEDFLNGDRLIYRGQKSIEVILNGPGLSKAKQKILREFAVKGYVIKEDFRVLKG